MKEKTAKTVMDRIKIKNEFLTNGSPVNKSAYSQQRNFCVSSVRK